MRPTCDLQFISADLTLEVNTPPPFSVISSTQAGHIHNTLIMDIHIAGWWDRGNIRYQRKASLYIMHLIQINQR